MNVTVLVKDTLFKVINVVHVFVINVNVRPVILGTPVKKTWGQKIKDWLF
jgi:hypothetical protein